MDMNWALDRAYDPANPAYYPVYKSHIQNYEISDVYVFYGKREQRWMAGSSEWKDDIPDECDTLEKRFKYAEVLWRMQCVQTIGS